LPATSLPSISSDLRSGQSYRIYHSSDVSGILPEDYQLIIRRVSKWTGVDERYVCGVVERFERRLVRWWHNTKKEEPQKNKGNDEEEETSEE
jgi:RNA polymerase I-specific transcription initiation factor RRN7